MNDEERIMLEALVKREGLTASDIVRALIRRTYVDAFGEAPTKRRRKKR